jgi:hypothetical protein
MAERSGVISMTVIELRALRERLGWLIVGAYLAISCTSKGQVSSSNVANRLIERQTPTSSDEPQGASRTPFDGPWTKHPLWPELLPHVLKYDEIGFHGERSGLGGPIGDFVAKHSVDGHDLYMSIMKECARSECKISDALLRVAALGLRKSAEIGDVAILQQILDKRSELSPITLEYIALDISYGSAQSYYAVLADKLTSMTSSDGQIYYFATQLEFTPKSESYADKIAALQRVLPRLDTRDGTYAVVSRAISLLTHADKCQVEHYGRTVCYYFCPGIGRVSDSSYPPCAPEVSSNHFAHITSTQLGPPW